MTEGREVFKKYENPVSNYGYYTAPTTTSEIWTPTSGTKAIITDIIASTTTVATITLYLGNTTTAIPPLFFSNNDKFHHTFMEPIEGATDEIIRVSVSAGTASILLMGREE